MRTFIKAVALAAVVLFASASQNAYAALSTSKTVNVSSEAPRQILMVTKLFKNTVTAANDITAGNIFNYGTLQLNASGNLVSSTGGSTGVASGIALISVSNNSLAWKLEQTGTAPTSGANTLPAGACTVVPVYAAADNGGVANDGTLGTAGTWVATNKALFTSNANGKMRVIQAHYSITDDPAAGATSFVSQDQKDGVYTNTVVFTATSLV